MALRIVSRKWWTPLELERRKLPPYDRVIRAVRRGELPVVLRDDDEALIDLRDLDVWPGEERGRGNVGQRVVGLSPDGGGAVAATTARSVRHDNDEHEGGSNMSYDPGYDEPVGAGIDASSLGREYDYGAGYDPDAIAQAAAKSVHQAYYPVVTEQQADAQLAEQAMRIAGQRLDASYKPGWFEANRAEIVREINARPGLLPDAALGDTPEQLADGTELVARKLYGEAVEQHRREQASRNAADIAGMKSALDQEHRIRIVKRELNRER